VQHSHLKVSPCQPLSGTARSGSPTAGSSQSPENWGPCDISQQGRSENWSVSLTGDFPTSWYEAIAELLHVQLEFSCASEVFLPALTLALAQDSARWYILPRWHTGQQGEWLSHKKATGQPNAVYLQPEREGWKWCSQSSVELCQFIPL